MNRSFLEIVVWFCNTFGYDLEFKDDFTKILGDSCEKCLYLHLYSKCFPTHAFGWKILSKLQGLLLAHESIDGL